MRIESHEFVFPIREGWSGHASHFTVLPDGRVFCVFFYGSYEGNDDVRIWGAMREPGVPGKWSEPVPLTPDDGIPHWNPVLFARRDGTVVLFYKVGKTIPAWRTFCIESSDGCATWSEPREMVPGDESGGRGPVRNKAIYLSDDTVLAPGSTEGDEWKCFIDRSTDGGLTWIRSEDLRIPQTRYAIPMPIKYDRNTGKPVGRGVIQPTLWEDARGVHALMRSSEERIYRSDSTDGGITWCPPYSTELPNNNSGIDLACLPDGRLVLACNPIGKNWGGRSPLSLLISEDGGASWRHLTHLETGSGKYGYAYPAIRYADGALHITYTWCRQTIAYVRLTDI